VENSLTKAVNALTGLLDTNDSRLKRLVCNDIIDHILQRKEIDEKPCSGGQYLPLYLYMKYKIYLTFTFLFAISIIKG
jgi:hypothetical protein